jgi:hypothetical protein
MASCRWSSITSKIGRLRPNYAYARTKCSGDRAERLIVPCEEAVLGILLSFQEEFNLGSVD